MRCIRKNDIIDDCVMEDIRKRTEDRKKERFERIGIPLEEESFEEEENEEEKIESKDRGVVIIKL